MKLLSCIALFVLLLPVYGKGNGKKKIFVADHKEACSSNSASDCFLVKEGKKGPWKKVTDIKGFAFEEGFEYKLLVQQNSDIGSLDLVKILSKKKTSYQPSDRLKNKQWYLFSLHEDTTFINLVDTSVIYMNVDPKAGSVSIKGVCNQLNGKVTTDKRTIRIADMVSTKVACQGNVLENIITNLLHGMTTFQVTGNTLQLTSEQKTRMVFKAYKEAEN